MTRTRTKTYRPIAFGIVTIVAVLVATLEASAQQPSSSDQFNTLMSNRLELSRRSVDDTLRRRLEDKKSDSTFPSDGRTTKAGVTRALSPEQQKAFQHNERGLQFFVKGKLDSAIKEYQEAIRFDPQLALAHNNLGSAYFSGARFEEAAAEFQKASELDPNYGQAFFNLALAHIKLGHDKEANETLYAAIRAYNAAGEAHLRANRLKEAEEAFRGMFQIDPEYGPAFLQLGLVYNDAGRYDEAERNVRRVADREPANAIAHAILAEALYGQRKYEESITSADRALKLSPKFPYAHYFAGLSCASLGRREAALDHLAQLQKLNSPEMAQRLSGFINTKAPAK
jgi:tetratricopeptide (TPR) repeat protein